MLRERVKFFKDICGKNDGVHIFSVDIKLEEVVKEK